MKKLNYYRPSFCQFRIRHFISVSFTISILIAMTLMLSSYSYNAKAYTDDLEFSRHLILPDSIDDSTTITENYGYGDTMFFYLDGPDTIYVLFADTTTNDSVSTLERAYTSQDILISLSEIELPVQNGLYGFNISDFYRFTHYDPNDNEIYEDLELENPHELIVSLAPKNLRYPSGASSKFRHAFGSMNSTNPDNPFAGLKNGGYGINIEELIPYYNKSDNVIDIISFLSIYIDYTEDMQFDIDGTWLTNDVKSSFEDYFGEWLEQPHYVPAAYLGLWEEPLHINEFIRTIDAIQEGNPGFTVDVIFTLNILSEPAEVCKEIVNYLRYETNNHVVNVNVVGVELGNESYASFFAKTMGFNPFDGHTAFEHYWFYINGTDDYDVSLPGAGDDFNLTDVLPAAMIGLTPGGINRHDYIRAFKTDATFDEIKIGIPAENPSYLPAEDDGPFIVEPDEDQPGGGANMGPPSDCDSWNECLYYRYSETISGKYKFDAVIPHLYFTAKNDNVAFANTNWGEIPIGLGPNCLDENLSLAGHQNFLSPPYSYITPDPRLACAFNGIVSGTGYTLAGSGSFREFLATRQKIGIMDLNEELHFEHFSNKECWPTEWNIKNNSTYENNMADPDYDFDGIAKETRRDVYANRFVHSYLLQEELLNFIKFNNNVAFRQGFMKYANLQNYLGGSTLSLLSRASDQDKIELGIGLCDEPLFDPYLARTTYYSMRLMNKIALKNLSYLKSTQNVYYLNINRPVTMFISELPPAGLFRDVYGYFSNIKNIEQTYVIRPGNLPGAWFTGLHAEIHCVDGLQLYSGSGTGALYDINNVYLDCEPLGFEGQFEIQNERPPYIDYSACPAPLPAGAMCVTVPAYSVGYFVFNYSPFARLEKADNMYEMYPNPANTSFTIKKVYSIEVDENQTLDVNIRNITGAIIKTENILEGEKIDISMLAVGVYLIEIKSEGHPTGIEQLVKMK